MKLDKTVVCIPTTRNKGLAGLQDSRVYIIHAMSKNMQIEGVSVQNRSNFVNKKTCMKGGMVAL